MHSVPGEKIAIGSYNLLEILGEKAFYCVHLVWAFTHIRKDIVEGCTM